MKRAEAKIREKCSIMNTGKETMGKKLKAIRVLKGHQAKEVAEFLGISVTSLWRKEREVTEFSGVEVAKLCVLYDVDIRELLD